MSSALDYEKRVLGEKIGDSSDAASTSLRNSSCLSVRASL